MLSVSAGMEAASMVADRAARGRGSVAPWESGRNSWDSAGSGPGVRGKKRYDFRCPPPSARATHFCIRPRFGNGAFKFKFLSLAEVLGLRQDESKGCRGQYWL